MIATKDVPNRYQYSQEALDAALKSTSIDESANDLDTLACVYAFRGDTSKAIKIKSKALDKDPGYADFTARKSLFQNGKDCTGQK
jgi:tetratricopeptide (TPR) repeat protein